MRAEALFAKRILVGVHKTKGNDRKVESTGGPFSTPGFRAQVARVELEISVFSFYGCLPFVRTIATEATSAPRKPEKKKVRAEAAKRESIYRVSRNVSVNLFFWRATTTLRIAFFSVIDQRLGA